MPKIQLLSEDLINKIAAGEVIERPASVVKELVENSVDAGAARIVVEIKDSGKELIKVSDNGEGMDEADARTSLLRHATSKIKTTDDLFCINTLGFRGEALASIAAVSLLSISTKRKDQSHGFNLAAEGGITTSSGVIAAETGTSIEVRHLFFNTPARKKFLKTDVVELRHIIDIITHYALCNPRISFRLTHDKYELLNAPAVNSLRDRVAAVYGNTLAREMLEVQYSQDGITIAGLIAPPSQARNDKQQQVFFVNKRWIRNEDIANAVYDAYHSTLFVHKHPVVVLNITLNPEQVDVNVHPTKMEIKIEQKELVYAAVRTAVQETLQLHQLLPQAEFTNAADLGQQMTFGMIERRRVSQPSISTYPFSTDSQSILQIREAATASYASTESYTMPAEHQELVTPSIPSLPTVQQLFDQTGSPDSRTPLEHAIASRDVASGTLTSSKFPPLKLLGQVHRTFFIAETPNGAFFIDQHAAHERVLYERFREQYLHRRVTVQQLLKGELFEFTPSEKALLLEHQATLQHFGFILELFGENTFAVKTIPLILERRQPKEIIYDILISLKEGRNRIEEVQEQILTRMACRAAVMAGDELTIGEMEKILLELALCKLPYTCPHGRPVMFKITVDELEKKFKRK